MSEKQKFIISEFYEFKGTRKLIEEAEKNNRPVTMTGILQKANTLNRNGRVYPFEILKREVQKYMEAVEEGRAIGECDHPDSAVISLANVSHKVTDMWWQGEVLYGKVQITETPAGDILKGLLKSEVMLGISSRGVGSVKSKGNQDVVQEDFELIAFDFVSSPSTPGAYMFKESKQWGLTPLLNSSSNIITNITKEDVDHEIDKYRKLKSILSNNYWNNI